MTVASEKLRKKVEDNLLELSGVSGVSHENDGGRLVVYVESLQHARAMPNRMKVDNQLVDVKKEVIGRIEAYKDRTGRFRPVLGGVSIGSVHITAGTLSLVDNNGVMLSNAHVFALGCGGFCEKGTDIVQPGRYNGGTSEDKVGELSDHVNIVFNDKTADNRIDAATATLTAEGKKMVVLGKDNESEVKVGTRNRPVVALLFAGSNVITVVSPIKYAVDKLGVDVGVTAEVSKGDTVAKSGRTTGWLENTVKDTGVSVKVHYGGGNWAVYRDQILVNQPYSAPGDSGSICFFPAPTAPTHMGGYAMAALAISLLAGWTYEQGWWKWPF